MATIFNPNNLTQVISGDKLNDVHAIIDAIQSGNGATSAYNITALGNSQTTAYKLTSVINEIDNVAVGTGVLLPSSGGKAKVPFQYCVIINNSLVSLQVYGNGADAINGVIGTTGIVQFASTASLYVSAKKGAWFSLSGEGSSSSSSNPNQVRMITSGTVDTATSSDNLIQWDSSVNSAKTENIPAGVMAGQVLQINDGLGTSTQYPITLVGGNGVTIGGNASLALSSNFFNITLEWDGFFNWIITSYYNGSLSVVPPSYLLVNPSTIMGIDSTPGDNILIF